jgi:protein-tyrosine phosphatase
MYAIHDLHNHLLPNVDDGARSLAETLRHLRNFHDEGVAEVVFTPHLLLPGLDEVCVDAALEVHRARFDDVLRAVDGGERYPRLRLGQEILARNVEDIEKVVARPDVGMSGGSTLLVEFGFTAGFDAEGVIARIRMEGRSVLVAHPERYDFGGRDPLATVSAWRESGAMMQLNGGSLAGLYTWPVRDLAWRLVKAGLVDIVSSDHHGDARPHSPRAYASLIQKDAGVAMARRLMGAGPREILSDLVLVGAPSRI